MWAGFHSNLLWANKKWTVGNGLDTPAVDRYTVWIRAGKQDVLSLKHVVMGGIKNYTTAIQQGR